MRQTVMGRNLFPAPAQPLLQVRHCPPKTLFHHSPGFHFNFNHFAERLSSALLPTKPPALLRSQTEDARTAKISQLTRYLSVILYKITPRQNITPRHNK